MLRKIDERKGSIISISTWSGNMTFISQGKSQFYFILYFGTMLFRRLLGLLLSAFCQRC